MKKYTKLLVLGALGLVLTGCNPKNPDDNEPAPQETITVTLDKTTASVDPNTTVTLTATTTGGTGSDVTWTSNNTDVATVANGVVTGLRPGIATITATYEGVSKECTIKVLGTNDYYYIQVNPNKNIAVFEQNVLDAEDEFRGETSKVIEVGDYNPFDMKPELLVKDIDTDQKVDESLWDYDYTYTLKVLENGAYVDTTTEYAVFDAKKATFDFNDAAVGKQFKLSVTPGGLEEEDLLDPTFTVSAEVKVSKGYNVYNANELAYFNDPAFPLSERQDETVGEDYNAGWVSFREAHNLDASYVAPGIFLQSNIKILKENLPDVFFWGEGQGVTPGTMKDSTDVYARSAADFAFNGNYFNVDTKDLPVAGNCTIVSDNISHSTLFKVTETRVGDGYSSNLVFKNCSYFGNAPRGNDESARLGLIFFKVHNNPGNVSYNTVVNATFDNFNVTRAAISFYAEYAPTKLTIKDSTATEGYANGIYLYLHSDLDIINSKLTGFGGPIIICDSDSTSAFNITASNDSILENWVSGGEPWFVNTGAAAMVPTIQALNELLYPFGKSFLNNTTDKLINMIVVGKGDSPYISFTKGDNQTIGFQSQNPLSQGIIGGPMASGAPVLLSSAGGAAYTDTTALYDLTQTNISNPEAATNPIYQGNYLDIALYVPEAFGYINVFVEYLTVA